MQHDIPKAVIDCLAESSGVPLAQIAPLVERLFAPEQSPPSRQEINQVQRAIRQLLGDRDTIDLIYGGATKIKGYVFESARLPEIRGASALLDFAGIEEVKRICGEDRVIYAGGGSFLAIAPAGEGAGKAKEIEQRFTELTQTALSVVVSATFHVLELRYGRLAFGEHGLVSYWIEEFQRDWRDPDLRSILAQYYYPAITGDTTPGARFYQRKSFGELVTVLATMYNHRRDERSAHGDERALPLVERLPWVARCASSDHRPAALIDDIYGPLSEASARKVAIGRLVKRGEDSGLSKRIGWHVPEKMGQRDWSQQWVEYLNKEGRNSPYAQHLQARSVEPAFDTHQIGEAGGGFIGLIYADGNNVGRMIATKRTPEDYAKFSDDLEAAAKHAVFAALAKHMRPADVADEQGNKTWCHPFEILTIGGDDLFLIVPGNKALEIALSIGHAFEQRLGKDTQRFSRTLRESNMCTHELYYTV